MFYQDVYQDTENLHTHEEDHHHLKNKRKENNKCWRGCVEIGTLLHRWWECKMAFPQKKLNIELAYDLGIPLLDNNKKQGFKQIFAHPCS